MDQKEELLKIKDDLEAKLLAVNTILNANIDVYGDNGENAVTNTWDKINILVDMKKDLSEKSYKKYSEHLLSLFHHADNINFIYQDEKKQVPTWYRKKYSHKFL